MRSWGFLCAVACLLSVNSKPIPIAPPAVNNSVRLFQQISADLAPYAAGIDRSMVDKMYCSCVGPSFRVQIKGNELYIAGETHGFQSRNRNVKLALLEVARSFPDLPEVDFVLGSDDFSASESGVGGPIFAQVCMTADKMWKPPYHSCHLALSRENPDAASMHAMPVPQQARRSLPANAIMQGLLLSSALMYGGRH